MHKLTETAHEVQYIYIYICSMLRILVLNRCSAAESRDFTKKDAIAVVINMWGSGVTTTHMSYPNLPVYIYIYIPQLNIIFKKSMRSPLCKALHDGNALGKGLFIWFIAMQLEWKLRRYFFGKYNLLFSYAVFE